MAIKPAAQSEAQQADTPTNATPAPTRTAQPLRLGTVVNVVVAPEVVLINNETGTRFVPGVPTPQTVTPTLIRRVEDGDLSIAP